MADSGVTTNPGTGGSVIDTEVIAARGARHIQRIKLALGDMDQDAGDVAADNPMPTVALGSGGLATGQGTATATAAIAIAARTGGWGTGRITATIENNSNNPIYLGDPSVTITTGKLLPGFSAITLPTQAAIWAVTVSGPATFDYVEFF